MVRAGELLPATQQWDRTTCAETSSWLLRARSPETRELVASQETLQQLCVMERSTLRTCSLRAQLLNAQLSTPRA